MFGRRPTFSALIIATLTGVSQAYWRMSCGIIQTGRIDPVVNPGKIAGHVHKIAGASNIGSNSSYDDLQKSSCTSCEIQADKSAYWTPLLYYQHANGFFEEVPNNGMTVYYLGRGDNRANIKPFPPGFQMLSGDTGARSYNNQSMTYGNSRPISDRVSFNCLDSSPLPETPNMARTNCRNGLRAQIHFQSCWDGVNLYKSDNSHVAYMTQIDNGVCPPGYPVQLVQLFYEVLYGTNDIKLDGGRFVFSQGDTTGYGFHGDFLNGWDMDVQTAALDKCANTDNGGQISACQPLVASVDPQYSYNCPPEPPLIDEPTRGIISKLPGCITITSGPGRASSSDMNCPANVTEPSINPSQVSSGPKTKFVPTIGAVVSGWKYLGCASEIANGRSLSGAAYTDSTNMSNSACQAFCASKKFPLAATEYGSECYCGLSLDPASSLNQSCNPMICSGNSSEYCGGPSRLNVWNSTTYSAPFPSAVGVSLGSSTYLGCANETSSRALSAAGFTNSTGMTNSACQAFCVSKNYALWGTEFGQECYCGNSLATTSSTLGQTGCTMTCAGNASELCGGPNRLTLWNNTLYKPVQVVPSVGSYLSQGCYTEGSAGRRALTGSSYADSVNMTVGSCVAYCRGKGFKWAGVEYSQECYCGAAVSNGGAPAESGCDMLCRGSKYEYCGGGGRLNVYRSS